MSETELQAQLAALRLELAQANRRAEEERAAKECTSVHFTYFSVLIRFS